MRHLRALRTGQADTAESDRLARRPTWCSATSVTATAVSGRRTAPRPIRGQAPKNARQGSGTTSLPMPPGASPARRRRPAARSRRTARAGGGQCREQPAGRKVHRAWAGSPKSSARVRSGSRRAARSRPPLPARPRRRAQMRAYWQAPAAQLGFARILRPASGVRDLRSASRPSARRPAGHHQAGGAQSPLWPPGSPGRSELGDGRGPGTAGRVVPVAWPAILRMVTAGSSKTQCRQSGLVRPAGALHRAAMPGRDLVAVVRAPRAALIVRSPVPAMSWPRPAAGSAGSRWSGRHMPVSSAADLRPRVPCAIPARWPRAWPGGCRPGRWCRPGAGRGQGRPQAPGAGLRRIWGGAAALCAVRGRAGTAAGAPPLRASPRRCPPGRGRARSLRGNRARAAIWRPRALSRRRLACRPQAADRGCAPAGPAGVRTGGQADFSAARSEAASSRSEIGGCPKVRR